MKAKSNKTVAFRYPVQTALGLAVLPIIFTSFLFYIVVVAFSQGDFRNAAWESLVLIFLLYISPSLALNIVTVKLSDEHISTYWAGIRTQQYLWGDISRIVKTKYFGNINPPNEYISIIRNDRSGYNIYFNAFGTVRFNDGIEKYPALMSMLNEVASQHHIPMALVDEKIAKSQQTKEARRKWMSVGTPTDQL